MDETKATTILASEMRVLVVNVSTDCQLVVAILGAEETLPLKLTS